MFIKSSKIIVIIVFSMIYLISVTSFIEFLTHLILGLNFLKIGTGGFLRVIAVSLIIIVGSFGLFHENSGSFRVVS